MEKNSKEKAIAQAKANLEIDHIYISDTFLENFYKKNNINRIRGPRLILKLNTSRKNYNKK